MSPWHSWLGLLSWCSIVQAIRCIRKISSKGAKSSNDLLKLNFMIGYQESDDSNGLLAWYLVLRVAHAPGMPGMFSPPPQVSDPDMHHGTGLKHVTWCMPGSLFSGFPWSRWRGKRSRHSRRMRNPQYYVSGKKPMAAELTCPIRTASTFVVWYRNESIGPKMFRYQPTGSFVGNSYKLFRPHYVRVFVSSVTDKIAILIVIDLSSHAWTYASQCRLA